MTTASATLLDRLLAEGAENDFYDCDSTCLFNGDLTHEERGNFSDLKRKGFVSVVEMDERAYWVVFSAIAMARYHTNHPES